MIRTSAVIVSRRVRLLLWCSIVSLGIVLAHPLYLPAFAEFLIAEDMPRQADAILVLAGGSETGGRLQRAVDLLNQGLAPLLVLSGVDIAWRTNYADINLAHAKALGVFDDRIVVVRHSSHSTIDEARAVLAALQTASIKRLIVVTSDFHTRRAGIIYRRQTRSLEMRVSVIAARDFQFDPRHWWTRTRDRKIVLEEYPKLLWYCTFGLS